MHKVNRMRALRRIFRNTIALAAADTIRLILGLALTAVIARRLGSHELGRFAYLASLLNILSVFGDLGLSAYYVRESQIRQREDLIGPLLCTRLLFGLVSAIVLVGIGWIKAGDPVTRVLLWMGSLILFLGVVPTVVATILRARELMIYEGILKLASSAATTAVGVAAVISGRGITTVVGGMIIVSLCMLLISTLLANRLGIPLRPQWRPLVIYVEMIRGALPFASLSILAVIYFRIDSIMLLELRGANALGQYSAAYRIMEAALLIPLTLASAAFPAISKALRERPTKVLREASRAIHLLAILAVPGAAFGWRYAPEIFRLLYGPGFEEAAHIFQVLALTLIAVSTSSVTSNIIAAHRPIVNVMIAAAMVMINVLLNLTLIPRWGGLGAAVATVITETFGLAAGTLYIHRRILPFWYVGEFMKPVAAALPLVFAMPLITPIAALPIWAGAYFALLWVFHGLTTDDFQFLRDLIRRSEQTLLSSNQ